MAAIGEGIRLRNDTILNNNGSSTGKGKVQGEKVPKFLSIL